MLRALWLGLLCTLFVALPARAQKARVTMISSATQVSVGEPFVIEIRIDVTGDDANDINLPDFGKLQVISQRVSRPFSFSFGFGTGGNAARVQSQIIHGYTLRATEPGTYVVQPAIVTIGGRKFASQRLSIEVGGTAQPQGLSGTGIDPNGGDDEPTTQIAPPTGTLSGAQFDNDLFLRNVVDKSQAYVGEQVTVTVYLYVRGGLSQNPTITREPTTEGFWVQDLLPVQRTLAPVRQEVNGRSFNAYVLRRYAAFPLRPGKLEIGAPAIEVGGGNSVFDLLTGPSAPVRRNGVAVAVEAVAVPEHPVSTVHVGSLTLEASLEPSESKVGDAATLRVVAKGDGNLKALKLPNPKLSGVDVLEPEIHDDMGNDLSIVGGQRVFKWMLLPRSPGDVTVPAFQVDVFDPREKTFSVQRTKPQTLHITGTALPSNAAPTPTADRAATDGAPSFGAVRNSSELARRHVPLRRASWFTWAWALAPLLVLAAYLGLQLRGKLQRRALAKPEQRAAGAAREQLKVAAAAAQSGDASAMYGAVIAALRGVLSARLGEPVGGMTHEALKARCVARGMAEPLAARVVRALERCEQERYDPSHKGSAELRVHVDHALQLVEELERFTARGNP